MRVAKLELATLIDESHMSQASVLEAGFRLTASPPGMGKRDFVSPVKFSQLVDGEDSSVTGSSTSEALQRGV